MARRFSSGFQPSLVIMVETLLVLLESLQTNLAALRCTASNLFLWSCLYGSHTEAQYSNLPAYLLKEVANELAPILCLLFNATLNQGRIPHEWKAANIVPIFKKDDKHRAVNYRPISLTSIVCKTAEHIIHSQIMHHLDTHNLLTESQFGFSKRTFMRVTALGNYTRPCHRT